MARQILATTPAGANMRLAVEIAWGADLTDVNGTGWTWTDISDYVLFGKGDSDDDIRIALGRPDESADTQTAEMALKLDNRAGTFSFGGMSPSWPNVRRNTPIRVRLSRDAGSTWSLRFQGGVVGFTPKWDEAGKFATVELLASGPLRRLDQGTLPPDSVFRRYMQANWQTENVAQYWAMEDPPGSKFLSQTLGVPRGPITLNQWSDLNAGTSTATSKWSVGSNTDWPAAAPLTEFFQNGQYTPYGWEQVPFPGSTIRQISGVYVPPASGNTASVRCPLFSLVQTNTRTGSQNDMPMPPQAIWDYGQFANHPWETYNNSWLWVTVANSRIYLEAWQGTGQNSNASGANPSTLTFSVNRPFTGVPFRWRFTWTGTQFTLAILNAGDATESSVSVSSTVNPLGGTYTYATSGSLRNSLSYTATSDITPDIWETVGCAAHICYQTAATSLTPSANYMAGYTNETPSARIIRLANQNGMAAAALDSSYTESANPSQAVGLQRYDTLSNLIREAEKTGLGLLFDGLGPGLTYATKRYRHASAAAAALTLDASQGHIRDPFEPIDDDQALINSATAGQSEGATAVYRDIAGPVGINAVGEYTTQVTVNPNDSTRLDSYAQWAVALGTRQGYRYSKISIELETNPSLHVAWLACTPQSRIDVTNLNQVRTGHTPDPVRLMLEGWEEHIGMFRWGVEANTSRAEGWNVIRLAAATGSTGDDISHMDTDSSQLNASVSAGATSIAIRTNSGPLWVTTTGDADSFPFDISIGGIRATVTAISGASSPQTATLSAGLPRAFTGSTTPGAGAPIQIWNPPVLGA